MADKKANRQTTNFFQRIGSNLRQFVRETIGELKKVSWPTCKEALNLTWIVLIVIFVMTIYLGVILDSIYAAFFRVLFGA